MLHDLQFLKCWSRMQQVGQSASCSVFSSVIAITERRDVALYEVPLFVSLLGFGIGTMLANFHV